MASKRNVEVSRLTVEEPHVSETQLELSLRQAFVSLIEEMRPPFNTDIPNEEQYAQLNCALVHGILTEPRYAKSHHIKLLHGKIVDGYAMFVGLLDKIVQHLYPKLLDSVKSQLLWVTEEMVDVLGVGFDDLLVSLLRQINGGDFSDGNLTLCWKMVTIFMDKWHDLLDEAPHVLSSALYVFLRVLADHCRPHGASVEKLETLRRLEIDLCVMIVREEFHLCLRIGRDFVRLLQDLVHVPEFRDIWKDLVLNPSKFNTLGCEGVSKIYRTMTCSSYVLLRINPEMESRLRFMMTNVKLGQQKRQQVWFAKKFLNDPDKETIIVDIVRFICCAIHPPNEIIKSDILPRWAVIGWLLKSCKTKFVEDRVKLALFYDWLFFDTKDNIMNIEPAILLMVNSIPQYIDMTHTLVEFLLHLLDNFDVEHKGLIVKGVTSAFQLLASVGVIQSYDVLTCCPALSPALKEGLGRLLSSVKH